MDDGTAHPEAQRRGYFPSLLEPRRRSERALLAVIQQAYVEGCIHKAGGRSGQGPGVRVSPRARCRASVRNWTWWWMASWAVRWGGGPYPLPVAGRTDPEGQGGRQDRQRQRGGGDGRKGEGKREIIGMDVGTSEDGAFWLAFLRSLSGRGLGGVGWWYRTLMRDSEAPSPQSSAEPAGNGAAPTS